MKKVSRMSDRPASETLRSFVGILLFWEALAKGPRRDADEATELLGEVAGAREAYLPGHHTYRQGGVREQRLGPFDPLPHNVLVRGEPHGMLEHPGEVVGAHSYLAGDLG